MRNAHDHTASGRAAAYTLALAVSLAAPAGAQTGVLVDDVDKLDIRHRTEHYAFAGTVSDARLTEYGRCLEYAYREYGAGFTELLSKRSARAGTEPATKTKRGQGRPPQPETTSSDRGRGSAGAAGEQAEEGRDADRFNVVIFATAAEYAAFGRSYFGDQAEHTRGLFVRAVDMLLICDAGDANETYEILFHEAFHQFVARYMPFAPIWVNEGLATYYGTARPTARGLVFDRPQAYRFRIVGACASAKQLIPLRDLMRMSRSTFYSHQPIEGTSYDHVTLSYAQAYTLVAYILSSADGQAHLREYLRDLAQAKTAKAAREATERHFPPSLLDAMVPEWLAKVNRCG